MNAVKTIFLKELMVEFRSKQMINSYFILSLMIITSFRFAFSVIDFSLTSLASPILWITFFFGGMFSLSPIYKREIEQGTREGLLLAPISPSSIYLGKFLANLLVISCLELFTLLIFFVFFPVDTPDLLALLTIVAIGTIGIVALGNIISAISSNLAQSEVMLPVLLVPVLLFTVIMSSVSATSNVFAGAHLLDVMQEIKFILAFDVVFLAVGYLLIDYILED
ncbi:ABC-type transport system involved in cytochrome c biogenesis, permease component [Thermoplasmatales archaeon SCGC AB-540-F20]|nr:ABC-type transport system involved in cytochrome c biogenesis, permease component [Thermoplasmatales archaeon SCGC AB-540-F20]